MSSIAVYQNNIVRQEADPIQYDNAEGILKYFGDSNNFPLRLAKLVQDSPTASACISTLSDFIEGAGFSNPDLSDVVINSQGYRFGDFHSCISDSYAVFEGFAILVKYSRQGRITELYQVPFENCRLGKPDSKGVISKIKVNPFFGTSLFKTQSTKEYDTFNPKPEVIVKQIERDGRAYKGQILYYGKPRPLSPFYPRPSYMSAENAMAIEWGIGEFHKNNLDNGFFQSLLIKLIGDENAPSGHPDDQRFNEDTQKYESFRTLGQRFNIEMQKFSGSKKAGNVMALWASMKDAMPELQAFPTSTNDTLFRDLRAGATDDIARATKVPLVLANVQTGATLGGDGNAIRASVKVMQQRVTRNHSVLERVYNGLFMASESFPKEEVKIVHYTPFPELEIVDKQIWEALTTEEKRNWIKKHTEIEILDTPVAAPAPAAPAENSFSNILFTDIPEGAQANAKRARKFYDDNEKKCGTPMGWRTNQAIIDGNPISYKEVKRIYNYLKRNESFKDYLFSESCEAVLYHAWGGKAMYDWAAGKINQTEK